MKHYSVMCNEIIDSLQIKEDGIYVDATLGYAGMSSKILEKLNDNGLLVANEIVYNRAKILYENLSYEDRIMNIYDYTNFFICCLNKYYNRL